MKRRIIRNLTIILMAIMLCMCMTGCDDGKDYTCGYCGREMEHYYDYVGGEYTCYSCSKALRD